MIILIKPQKMLKKEKKTPSHFGVYQGREKKAKKPKGRRGDMPPNQGKPTHAFMGLAKAGVPIHDGQEGEIQPVTIVRALKYAWATLGEHAPTTSKKWEFSD